MNYSNAKRNPNAQTRNWFMSESHAQHESKFNQVIGGRIKVSDCSQVTDGSVALFLASEKFASAWAKRNGKQLVGYSAHPRMGSSHGAARIRHQGRGEQRTTLMCCRIRGRQFVDAFKRAGIASRR